MPITPTYPGVYIEEVPSGVRTIVGVSTSVAAFVGFFSRGPLNKAVQVFNMGDFQREFGGLNVHSEASYAIQQFFLNGGTEAWAVRVQTDNSETASVTLQDGAGTSVLEVTAGRRIKGVSVDDPGEWGNFLRIDVDYNTRDLEATPPLFNLTVSEVMFQDGRQVVVQTETYHNLNMILGDSNYAVEVVNEASKLIQLGRMTLDDNPDPIPAQTGTWGTDASASPPILVSGNTFDINFGGGPPVTATISFDVQPETLQEVRSILQTAIRAVGAEMIPAEPLLTGATVQLIGNRFRVLAGRSGVGYNPETVLRFSDNSGTPATAMGLVGATENVQQYSVGSPNSVEAQVAGNTGSNGTLPGDLPNAGALIGVRDPDKTGIYALEDVDLFNILCIPRAAELSPAQMRNVFGVAQGYCEERRAFMIVDVPSTTNTMQRAREWLDDNTGLRHKNAAVYFPRPRVPDPLNNYRLKSVGTSGTMAGLYARTDAARGVWKAPAGIESVLRNVQDLDYKLTNPENGQLNPLGLNCLRNFDVYGNICWGARTLDGADQQASEWKYIPVRRLALFIEESLYRGTQWVVFEPNDEPLWAQIRLNVGAFMHGLFRQGAFQGTTPREAYLVKCDSETTTQADINRGVVNILVGFAPLKPAEFVIIRIQQLAGQIET